jgi:hypothetical protein
VDALGSSWHPDGFVVVSTSFHVVVLLVVCLMILVISHVVMLSIICDIMVVFNFAL